jgi:hypothetical protein
MMLIVQIAAIIIYSSRLLRLTHCEIAVVIRWLYLAIGRQHHRINRRHVVLAHYILRRLMSLCLPMNHLLMMRRLMPLHLGSCGTYRYIRAVR